MLWTVKYFASRELTPNIKLMDNVLRVKVLSMEFGDISHENEINRHYLAILSKLNSVNTQDWN